MLNKVFGDYEKWVEARGRLGRDDRNLSLCGDGHVVRAGASVSYSICSVAADKLRPVPPKYLHTGVRAHAPSN